MSVEQLQLQMGMGNLTVCGKYTVFFFFFNPEKSFSPSTEQFLLMCE